MVLAVEFLLVAVPLRLMGVAILEGGVPRREVEDRSLVDGGVPMRLVENERVILIPSLFWLCVAGVGFDAVDRLRRVRGEHDLVSRSRGGSAFSTTFRTTSSSPCPQMMSCDWLVVSPSFNRCRSILFFPFSFCS